MCEKPITEEKLAEMGKWERLGFGAKVFVTREHRFNTDTILLAHFASPNKNDVCADFGTGCGTIPIIWKARYNPKKVYAVEVQDQAFAQADLSVKECKLDIELIKGDIRDYKNLFKDRNLDLIACNPPYKAQGAGIKNEDEKMKIARHEEMLTMEELAESARFTLKFGGSLCICQRPERLTDAMNIMRKYDLEPKVLRLVQGRADKAPSLFLLKCRRGGKPGLQIMPTLLLEENGDVSKEMLEIYGDYKNY